VQALVERGWIVRTPDPSDRRQSLLSLTEQGRAHYERAQAQTLERLVPLMARLAPEELAAVRTALPALRRVLIQEEEDGGGQR
jgi:DNA-binding MarR family transcriptional regulator